LNKVRLAIERTGLTKEDEKHIYEVRKRQQPLCCSGMLSGNITPLLSRASCVPALAREPNREKAHLLPRFDAVYSRVNSRRAMLPLLLVLKFGV